MLGRATQGVGAPCIGQLPSAHQVTPNNLHTAKKTAHLLPSLPAHRAPGEGPVPTTTTGVWVTVLGVTLSYPILRLTAYVAKVQMGFSKKTLLSSTRRWWYGGETQNLVPIHDQDPLAQRWAFGMNCGEKNCTG